MALPLVLLFVAAIPVAYLIAIIFGRTRLGFRLIVCLHLLVTTHFDSLLAVFLIVAGSAIIVISLLSHDLGSLLLATFGIGLVYLGIKSAATVMAYGELSSVRTEELYEWYKIHYGDAGRSLAASKRIDQQDMGPYYDALGLRPGSTRAQIKRAYRRLALKYHPDVSKEPGAEERFKSINEAYGRLMEEAGAA